MKKTVAAMMICLFLFGCATLQPGADRVMITTNEPDPAQYEYLSDITASSAHIMGQGQSVESVRIKLRNKALAMGADIVKIDTNNQNHDEVTMSGRAFKKKN
jgi:hypothetical protein